MNPYESYESYEKMVTVNVKHMYATKDRYP